MEYQDGYGYSFNPRPPDFSRCAASVFDSSLQIASQCQRKAVCDPDENGKPTTCKQHSEEATRERRAAQAAKHKADMARWEARREATAMKDALQQIADGHNDPRGLAKEVLAKIEGVAQ